MLDGLVNEYGHIPYVINNAGLNIAAPALQLSPEDLEESMRVNALTPYRIMHRLLGAMVEHNFGRIINITSGAPLNCFPGYGAYSASKAALNALTVTAAREHAAQDIRINLMSPGPVRSGMAPTAPMDPDVCHPTLDYLLTLPADGPTGRFFWLGRELPLFPDLAGVKWLEGTATDRFPRVIP
jgi:NAD(P)-dependent dehydrogenase (short-subunit alcohol dehydrogenase family)